MTTKLTADQVREFLKRPGIHLPGIARECNIHASTLRNIKQGATTRILSKHQASLRQQMIKYGEPILIKEIISAETERLKTMKENRAFESDSLSDVENEAIDKLIGAQAYYIRRLKNLL